MPHLTLAHMIYNRHIPIHTTFTPHTHITNPAPATPSQSSVRDAATDDAPTDLDAFVARVHREVLGRAVLQGQEAARARTDALLSASLASEWERAKAVMLASLGLGLPPGPSARQGGAADRGGANSSSSAFRGALPFSPPGASPVYGGGAEAAPLQPVGTLPFGMGEGDADFRRDLDGAALAAAMDEYAARLYPVVRDLAAASQDDSAKVIPATMLNSFPVIESLAAVAEEAWAEDEARGSSSSSSGDRESGRSRQDVSLHTRMWRLLLDITREGRATGPTSGRGSFASGYMGLLLDDGSGPAAAAAASAGPWVPMTYRTSIAWAAGSIAYTEALFRHVLEAEVADNTGVARLGATGAAPTGLVACVRGHLNVELARHGRSAAAARAVTLHAPVGDARRSVPEWYSAGMESAPAVGGHPLWVQVFLCLRCGGRREALELLREGSALDPSRVPREIVEVAAAFVTVMDAGADASGVADTLCRGGAGASVARGLARAGAMFEALEKDRSAPQASAFVDPWQVEVLCLLSGSRGDPEHADDVVIATEHDYVWHRLWFAITARLAAGGAAAALRSSSAGSNDGEYTLWELGETVLGYGSAHFDPRGNRAYSYVEVLLLVGQPEAAVSYLAVRSGSSGGGGASPNPRALHDAVHLALALSHYGLLRSVPVNALTLNSGGGGVALAPGDAAALAACVPSELQEVAESGGLLYALRCPEPGEGGARDIHPDATRTPLLALDLAFLLSIYCARVVPRAPASVSAAYLSLVPQRPARTALLASLLVSSRSFNELMGPLSPSLEPSLEAGTLATFGTRAPVVPLTELAAILLAAGHTLREAGHTIGALALLLRVPGDYGGVGPAVDVLLRGLLECVDAPWVEAGGGAPVAAGGTAAAAAPVTDRAVLRSVGAAVLTLHAPRLSGAVAASDATSSSLSSRAHGVAVVLRLCAMYDALAARRWGDAVAAADAAEASPPEPSEHWWPDVFDPLPHALKDAWAGVMRGVMSAIVRAFAEARDRASAATGIAAGRALAEAMASPVSIMPNASVADLRALKMRVSGRAIHFCM